MMYCAACGQPIDDNSLYCPYCGASSAGPTLPIYGYGVSGEPLKADNSYEEMRPRRDEGAGLPPEALPLTASELPKKYRPLSPWAYFGLSLAFMIPLIGWILIFVFSFKSKNINMRNFAMSFLCFFLLFGLVSLIVSVFFAEELADLITKLSELF